MLLHKLLMQIRFLSKQLHMVEVQISSAILIEFFFNYVSLFKNAYVVLLSIYIYIYIMLQTQQRYSVYNASAISFIWCIIIHSSLLTLQLK